MKPSQVISKLRQIATIIENSKRPDKLLVAKDLKQVINRMAADGDVYFDDPELNKAFTEELKKSSGDYFEYVYAYYKHSSGDESLDNFYEYLDVYGEGGEEKEYGD
jgi:hypothetical protein